MGAGGHCCSATHIPTQPTAIPAHQHCWKLANSASLHVMVCKALHSFLIRLCLRTWETLWWIHKCSPMWFLPFLSDNNGKNGNWDRAHSFAAAAGCFCSKLWQVKEGSTSTHHTWSQPSKLCRKQKTNSSKTWQRLQTCKALKTFTLSNTL